MSPCTPSHSGDVRQAIAEIALSLGFAQVAFAPVQPFQRGSRALREWLAQGYHGTMAYMAKHESLRHTPQSLLQEARTIVVVALAYDASTSPIDPMNGFVARYARGEDYHALMKGKLYALAERCSTLLGRSVLARPCVDSAPLLEREAAALAGLGFIAKNTMMIVPGLGSYLLLGELLLDLELETGAPQTPRCGACTACLDACPTQAFVSPYVLDARRCISYLTIEYSGPIPRELRAAMGNMVFGCDICQAVCPFNASKKARPVAPELAPKPHLQLPALAKLLRMGSAEYRRFVAHSALRRASRQQLARNAAIALGNSGRQEAVAPLAWAVEHHTSPLVRSHAAWALGRLPGEEARRALLRARRDADPDVQQEAEWALAQARA